MGDVGPKLDLLHKQRVEVELPEGSKALSEVTLTPGPMERDTQVVQAIDVPLAYRVEGSFTLLVSSGYDLDTFTVLAEGVGA